jgi:hypothetical protein
MSGEKRFHRLRRLSRRFLVLGSVFLLLIAAVATTVWMQTDGGANKIPTPTGDAGKAAEKKTVKKNLVTAGPDGEPVVYNRETGMTRPLTQDESAKLAAGLRALINNTDEGLVQIQREDGSVSMDLQGHFQNVMLARRESDGTVSLSCVDNLEAAANFFEIDPVLLGLAARRSASRPSPTKLEDR